MFYETEHGINLYLGNLDAALARINRLLPDIPTIKNSPQYRNQLSTLELAAGACEMVFCGETTEAMEILDGIRDKLQTTEEGKRRLTYQLGAVLITVLVVAFYALNVYSDPTGHGKPWILAACLAMAGGVFSVCLNLGSLEVNVNQQILFLLGAGATRSVIAILAGVGLLLAMRAKMFAGIVYDGPLPVVGDPLTCAEMFFCFLAGFSESFVPNILRDSEKNTPGKGDAQKPGN